MKNFIIADGFWEFFNELSANQWINAALHTVWEILIAIIIWCVGKKLIALALKLTERLFERRQMEISVRKFLLMTLKWVLYILLIFTIVEYISGATASLMALLGSVGVTVGLALQGSLSNVAGGVLILLMRPFKVGNFIVYGAESGTVNEIGLIYTKLTTPDNREVIVPNGALANGVVVNVSAFDKRRVEVSVSIAYNSDVAKAKEVLGQMMATYSHILDNQEKVVFVKTLGDSAVVLECRCWIPSDYYWDAIWYLTENAKKALDEAGIKIPFPQMDVHMVSGE